MTKRKILLAAIVPVAALLLMAQTYGPQVFAPFLTVGSGTRATSGLRVNGDVTITGTCTGCGAGVANPTGTIGLTAVNGSATSAIRSDGAPPLSQAIVPTWTGAHTFTNGLTTNSATINTFPAHGVIACTTSCNVANIQIGQVAFIKKNADTIRNNTTTLSQDTDFVFSNVPIGTYEVRAEWNMTDASASGNGGLRMSLGANTGVGNGVMECNGAAAVDFSNGWNTGLASGRLDCTGPVGTVVWQGTVIRASSGTVSVFWAQNVASATDTTLKAASILFLTRVI